MAQQTVPESSELCHQDTHTCLSSKLIETSPIANYYLDIKH